jgi:branched-chain amino acid transport system permease protein
MTRRRLLPAVALIVVAIALLLFAPTINAGALDLGVTLLTYLAIAQAWNVLAGFAGQISLGSAAFVCVGAYTSAILLLHTGLQWPIVMVISTIGAVLLSALVSIPLLRLRGDYFAVGTLAIAIALQSVLTNWQWTGGASGVVLTSTLPTGVLLFQIAVVIGTIAMGLAIYVKFSPFGLRLTAIRDNEEAAAGLGVAVTRHRVAALMLTSAIIGMTGSLVAFHLSFVSPDSVAGFSWSLNALLMATIGGGGTILGPVIGVAVAYYGLQYALQNEPTIAQVLEGILLILIVRFAPQGIWPLAWNGVRRVVEAARRRLDPASVRAGNSAPSGAEDPVVPR